MGFFSFIQEIAMDLGTANTIIISDDKIVVDEPSVVALDRRTDKMIAVGDDAKLMYEKEQPNIRTIRPLKDGVIADFSACEQMMRGLIKKVHSGSRLFSPSLRMVIGVPSGSTEVELRAVRDSAEHADGRDVFLIFEPMAAAIGIGIDVEAPEGNMIVDIGGGTTEIAVISLGGIVANNSIKIAGDDLNNDIQDYMSRQHNVKIGERMAERIKINVGSALTDLGEFKLVDLVVIEQVVQGKGKTRLQCCRRRQSCAQGHIAGKHGIKALHCATTLDGLAAHTEDVACPLLLRSILLIETELTVSVHVHTVNAHLGSAVDIDCSHDVLVNGSGEHKSAIIVGVFADEVNTTGRCIDDAIGTETLLELRLNLFFHCYR